MSGADGEILLAHPSRLFAETLADTLRAAGLPFRAYVPDLPAARASLQQQPAQLALVGAELAADGIAPVVSGLLDAGAGSVVVLAPEVREPDLLAALQAGALGYVGRDESLDRLVFDIRGALAGQACLPRDKLAPVLRLLIDQRREQDGRTERLARLSKRERQILDQLSRGMSNDEIAGTLFLSPATVRTHVQNILGKLEVHSRLAAIALVNGGQSTIPQEPLP